MNQAIKDILIAYAGLSIVAGILIYIGVIG
jgi:hypothetical protein